jgi:chemotaxis protein methyltransferase CheR
LESQTFEQLRDVVYQLSGIALGDRKQALLAARLGKRMHALGMRDYDDYVRLLHTDETGDELRMVLDAVSTNVTSFFREPQHFDLLREVTGQALEAGQRRFRFWSTACSTGEEPLSIAMTMADVTHGMDVDIRILATDISGRAIERCVDGTYTAARVADVPEPLRQRSMEKHHVDGQTVFRPRPEVRAMIAYHRLNLSAPPFPMLGPFDAIFCRNVMIYFDNPVRAALLAELYRLVKRGGYLFVGHAESLTGMMSGFKSVRPSVYLRP